MKMNHHLAQINGYNKTHINNILKKHLTKKRLSEMSTFLKCFILCDFFRPLCEHFHIHKKFVRFFVYLKMFA